MGALLAEFSFVEYQDAVGVLNGAEAMSDHHGGTSTEQTVQGFADLQFGFGVHAGGGFVKNQKTRIVRQCARETDQLALAAGKRGAALVHFGGYTSGESAYKIAQADFVDGVLYRGAINAGRSQADVRFDGAGEQEGILQDNAKLAAQILQVDGADVHAVEEDLSALHVVEAQQ